MAISPTTKKVILDVAIFIATQVMVLSSYGHEGAREVKAKPMEALKRLGHAKLKLDEYEKRIASEVIHPDDIDVTFSDVGGLEDIISSLQETVIIPLLYPTSFGVLLYGPPGCGKTMLAKALAKESGATFINIAASVLTNNARKAQPSIIFIDEVDSFLRERSKGDHEATALIKAEFMTLWDGLLSGSERILILGATNRIRDIDPAFLRRMPKQDVSLAPSFPIRALAEYSKGKSGSDLKELCRNAAMLPVRELVRKAKGNVALLARGQEEGFNLRPLTIEDFLDPDGSLTGVDTELDHAESTDPDD
ncbi:AAA-domain-containing protein [Russula brevipes]|nr:AAA-domain-containing protein [Russula brevipes]